MISTAIQLKAKIRNVSKGNDRIAKSYTDSNGVHKNI